MKKLLLILSINLLIGFTAFAQTENVFQRLDIRNVTSSEVRNSLATVPSGQLLVLDETKGEQLFNVKGSFTMQIPLSKGSIEIELEPANILSPDFKVTTSNGSVAAVDLPHFYHGKIKGVPTSAVAIAITKDAIEGLITDDKINLTIGRLKNSTEKLHVVYNTADIPFTNSICSGTVEEQIKESVNQGGGPQTNLTTDCKAIEIYFEADFRTYTDWGSNVQTVVNTITGIFNNVSLLYSNVGVNVVISELKVWDTQQPYSLYLSASSNLYSFRSYLNDKGNDFSGDLAHLVSTSSTGGSALIGFGQSVFNGMTSRAVFSNCDKSLAKAFSGSLTNSVVNIPTYSWNVGVIAHELGHNFGLRHTHSCTWSDGTNIGPIDNCSSVDDGPCTPGPAPTNGGTIMSYCHENASIGINLANGFGPLPSAKILAEVNAATCLSGSRIKQPAVASASQVICQGETVTITASGCSGVYNWYDAATGGTSLSTNSTYTTPALTENKSYYVSCTFDGCTSRRKKVDVLIINGGLVNSDRFYCNTTNSGTLSLVNYAGSIIRWESSIDNFSTATTIANTSTTLTYDNVSTTTKYRAVVQQGACSRFSQPATVLINNTRIYVNKNATGLNDGTSWLNAFTDLQSALNFSCPAGIEIWVAKGTYKPTIANGDRNLSFIIKDNFKVYGGFAGTELLLTDRNYSLIHTTNSTILSGDLNGNDGANFANNIENSYVVVRMTNATNTTRLDGFCISGGNNTVAWSSGGGILLQNSSAVIANCNITDNHTDYLGGGIANSLGQPTIENCSFLRNRASSHGGALFNLSNSGTAQTINISNSVFVGNSVVNNSGSILFNYAISTSGTTQNVNLTNCSFSGNTSPNHGIYNAAEIAGSAINTSLKNCAFFNNGGNKTIFNETSGGTSTTTANYCFFQSSVANFTGSNNIISDTSPFVSATDLHLNCSTLAVNRGTDVGVLSTDVEGNSRPFAGTKVDIGAYEFQGFPSISGITGPISNFCSPTNSGTLTLSGYSGNIVRWESSVDNFDNVTDIANTSASLSYSNINQTTQYRAFTENGTCSVSAPAIITINPTRLYVNKNATGANNGASWTEAFTVLQSALNLSCPSVTEIWVAKGIYKPAAANGDRNLSFNIRNNLKVYGGFSGTEVQLSDRNYNLIHTINSTIMSGDLNGNDGANFTNNAENSYVVVRLNNVTNTTRLDGFGISGGNNTVASSLGGGILLQNSSAVIANCKITDNHTDFRGGGIANSLGQPTVENCSFLRNRASSHGGAMYNLSNSGTAQTINISNSVFVGNSVVTNSGSILFNYAFFASGTTQNVNLTNCSFSGNTSPNHGIYNLAEVVGSAVNTSLVNCAFYNNGGNKTLFNETSGGVSATTANHSFFQSSVINFTGSNNVISDTSPFVSTTDLHLPCGSLAANSGTSAGISATDLDGNPRPFAGTVVDIGAYELQGGMASDPTTISVSSKEICLPANITLSANCAVGLPTWYSQANGGTALGTGTSFVQSPSSTSTYYLECSNVCAMGNRLPTPEVVVANSAATLSLTLDFAVNSTQIANTIISATNKIIDPARVIYKAGKSVTLNQGFEANNGSTFIAQIGGCQNVDIPGLVAFYPFNGNANDETGNGINGIIDGATLTADKFGAAQKALNFDGNNDFVRIPNLYNAATQPLNSVTYSLWFKPNQNYGAADFYSLIIRTTDGGFTDMIGKPDLSSVENNKFQFYMFDNVENIGRLSKATTIDFLANVWVHVVATRANGTMKIYLNAVKEGETAYPNPSVFYPDLYLGGHSTFNRWYFNGAMDDVRVYNRALTDAEIQAIYNAEKL
ncbi:LamG-like jellyroll fold domain-containing protein [Lacihabitans sp. LS3-19]|uniref:Ig-like domain-containing protein n=1 Tax=Lacihabitans sp. LS3-19 TaxID=2487335 RepID=UPI0020CF354C|nr:LamG-like jellyroll fold domain-containing protein [Lacihabitans sp. LS3-19]